MKFKSPRTRRNGVSNVLMLIILLKTCRVDRIQCLKIRFAQIINAYFRLCAENSCMETLLILKAKDIATSCWGVQGTLSLLVVSNFIVLTKSRTN